ncbi:hypothetical protein GCM10009740_38470 [Terrabacter terrae]|uniref:DUF222 domain-containing protein n=1 Tax=Terrabacter terrae TaxID=318434 RepID=A0ABP4KEW1_9MICO
MLSATLALAERLISSEVGAIDVMLRSIETGIRRVATEAINLSYDGPGLEAHTIDVRELAPALIAVADLFVTAHLELGREGVVPAVRVIATSEGSFVVHLLITTPDEILQHFEPLADWLNTSGPIATATGLSIVVPVLGGVSWMVKRARHGREKRVARLGPGEIEIEWPDGTKLRTVAEAAGLADSMDMRRAVQRLAEPLNRQDDINRLKLEAPTTAQPVVTIEPPDLHLLEIPAAEDSLLTDTEREVVLRLKKVAFDHERKWHVTDGASTFWAAMTDIDFALKVADSEESFSANDQLRCMLRERQFATAEGGIRVEHSITHVLEHRRAPHQARLPLQD